MSVKLNEIVTYLDQALDNKSYQDEFLNGLQIDSGNVEVLTIAAAVDSGLSIIEKAVAAKADLLITHHGILTTNSYRLNDVLGKKIQLLIKNGCSFYSSHLPLDGNMDYGNAAELARHLKLNNIEPHFSFLGKTIGVKAKLEESKKLEDFIAPLSKLGGAITPLVLPFGKKQINTVGIVTGSGTSAISECSQSGIDLLISGEPKQSAYHLAKEYQVNAIFAGHYATETFGVQALLNQLAKIYSVRTVFIDEPTGI